MKKLGIGYENYKEFTDLNMYYVDKTLLIRDLVDKGGKTTLFTRPRRFGKTLALSMIRTFFELEYDRDGNVVDNRRYFSGMKIEQCEDIMPMLGQYPVIKLSLKSAKQPDFYSAFMKLREEIVGEFGRHRYVMDSDRVSSEDRSNFKRLHNARSIWYENDQKATSENERDLLFKKEVTLFSTALKTLSDCLKQHHGKNVIILIDEYDVPLENAYFTGFYDEMVGFIRSLFESALKTNDALERAVVTGCLRISKESIFTGLNNLEVCSVRNTSFDEYFGFTQQETEAILDHYGLTENVAIVKEWYDGYLFGNAEVYNPWSVIKYISEHRDNPSRFPEPYWANTSSNSIIKELVYNANEDVKRELEGLIAGGTIEKRIHEDITYGDIHDSEDNLWNFLFFTGYMKKVSERQAGRDIYMTMCIPNQEVASIYDNQISEWFDKIVKSTDRTALYNAIRNKDADSIADIMQKLFKKSISTFDSSESFYHGYMLSLLLGMPDYAARSNREAGDGRPDIILYPEGRKDPAYIFEIKVRKKFNEMDDGLQEAFDRIRDKRYEDGILEEGYAGVISFGVCFCKKSCIAGLYDPGSSTSGRPT